MKHKILHQRKIMGGVNAAKENEYMVQKQVRWRAFSPQQNSQKDFVLVACAELPDTDVAVSVRYLVDTRITLE